MITDITRDFGELGTAYWFECRPNGFDCSVGQGGWGF
jgi:hypothetical protein